MLDVMVRTYINADNMFLGLQDAAQPCGSGLTILTRS